MADWNAKHLMCRGKAAHGWAAGYYLPQDPSVKGSGASIFTFPKEGQFDSVCFAVEPETVTACSGMQDQKGTLIYDQDLIVNYKTKEGGLVEYSESDGMFGLVMKDGTLCNFAEIISTDWEIVGNTFDNPDYMRLI